MVFHTFDRRARGVMADGPRKAGVNEPIQSFPTKDGGAWVFDLYWDALEIVILSKTCDYIQTAVATFATPSGTADWNFGQFIAVMVWAPTISKFLYFSVCESSTPPILVVPSYSLSESSC